MRLHHRLADAARIDFPLAALLQLTLKIVNDLFDSGERHRPFFTGPLHAGNNLEAVEGLPATVLLDHQRQNLLDPLVGGEAPFALQAFPAPANTVAFLAKPRIDDLVIGKTAKRAFHDLGPGLSAAPGIISTSTPASCSICRDSSSG